MNYFNNLTNRQIFQSFLFHVIRDLWCIILTRKIGRWQKKKIQSGTTSRRKVYVLCWYALLNCMPWCIIHSSWCTDMMSNVYFSENVACLTVRFSSFHYNMVLQRLLYFYLVEVCRNLDYVKMVYMKKNGEEFRNKRQKIVWERRVQFRKFEKLFYMLSWKLVVHYKYMLPL